MKPSLNVLDKDAYQQIRKDAFKLLWRGAGSWIPFLVLCSAATGLLTGYLLNSIFATWFFIIVLNLGFLAIADTYVPCLAEGDAAGWLLLLQSLWHGDWRGLGRLHRQAGVAFVGLLSLIGLVFWLAGQMYLQFGGHATAASVPGFTLSEQFLEVCSAPAYGGLIYLAASTQVCHNLLIRRWLSLFAGLSDGDSNELLEQAEQRSRYNFRALSGDVSTLSFGTVWLWFVFPPVALLVYCYWQAYSYLVFKAVFLEPGDKLTVTQRQVSARTQVSSPMA